MNYRCLAGRHKGYFRAQELVEFALVLPLLVLILFGAVDLGRIYHAAITITNAAREGARYAISYGYDESGGLITFDTTTIYSRTNQEANNSGIPLDSAALTCPEGCDHGKPVRITVTHNFQFLFNSILGSGLTLTRTAEMMLPW